MSSTASRLRFLLFVTGVAAIGGFLFGYDTAVINGANTYLKAHLGLSPVQEGLAGASAILGCIPGAMAAGFLSDRFGRRKMLFLCAILYAVSGLLSAVPRTFGEFLAARIISGLGIGASSMICPVYIAELAPEKWRGRLGSLFQLGIVTGIFLTLFVNRFIQGLGDEAWNTAMGWRWMLAMEVVPALLFFGLLAIVPESPRWLARRGRINEAHEVLGKVEEPVRAEAVLAEMSKSAASAEPGFSALFTPGYRRPLVLAVLLAVFQQFCGINAVMYYSTRIFESAGAVKDTAFTASVWVGLINLVFTLVAIAGVDTLGRRPLLLAGTLVQAVALMLVGWLFHTGQHGPLLLVGVVTFIAAFAVAMGPITWLFCSEIFPDELRGRAMSVAAFAVWGACYVVAQTFPMLTDSPAIGPARTFWLYAGASLLSFIFILRWVPETKGRTLEEIGRMWRPAGEGL